MPPARTRGIHFLLFETNHTIDRGCNGPHHRVGHLQTPIEVGRC